MNEWIVTNNEIVRDDLAGGARFPVLYIGGTVRDIVFKARELVLRDMALAADPLAGRKERANPFLSVVLEYRTGDYDAYHIERLEQMLAIFYKNEAHFAEMSDALKKDFAILDRSLLSTIVD